MCHPLIITSMNPNEIFVKARSTKAEETTTQSRASSCAWCRCGSKWMHWPWAVGDCGYHHGARFCNGPIKCNRIDTSDDGLVFCDVRRWMQSPPKAVTRRARPPRQQNQNQNPSACWGTCLTPSPRRCVKDEKCQGRKEREGPRSLRRVVDLNAVLNEPFQIRLFSSSLFRVLCVL